MLNVLRFGEAGKPQIVIAHGLYGSGRNWTGIARRLSDDYEVLCPDMRNHGDSPWEDTHTYPAMAGDLLEILGSEPRIAALVGHSMGGKAAMMAALSEPDRVPRLLVADIAPVGYSHTQIHFAEAMRALPLENIRMRSEANAMLTEAVPDKGTRAFLLQSLDLKSTPPRWKLNLPALMANMDATIGWPETTGRYEGPTLFLSGGQSDYVLPEHRPAIRELFPKARFAKLPRAGHWVHADEPEAFADTVRAFVSA